MSTKNVCIIATLIIVMSLIFTGGDERAIYGGMVVIAALGGVDFIKRRNGGSS